MTAVRTVLAVAGAFAVAAGAVAAGCGGGGGGGAGGTGGTGGTGAPGGASGSTQAACSLETRVGGFAVQLLEAAGATPYTSITGGVRNGVVPLEVWQQKGTAAGGCKLMVGPMLVCTTPCVSPQVCAGQNTCVEEPRLQGLGTVTLTGVGPAPITIEPIQMVVYSKTLTDPYPPFSPGAAVHLETTGAAIPAFALDAAGIQPLVFAGTDLTMRNGEALALTWTPPTTPTTVPILIQADIGHHGGVAAAIECELPDTGSGQIPAALVTALIAEGTAGFPSLSLTRRTISSKTVGPGCVELAVASSVERVIGVCPTATSCIVSCDPGDPSAQCPSGMTCRTNWTCG